MELAFGIIMVLFAFFWCLAYLISLFVNEPEKQRSSQPLTIANDTPTALKQATSSRLFEVKNCAAANQTLTSGSAV